MAEYEVTGVRYQMGDGLTMEERTRKAEAFIRSLEVGRQLILVAEPDNPKDCEAIAVYADFRRVGYIKREGCAEVKSLLDADGMRDAVVSGNDGHVTFYVEIAGAAEQYVSPCIRERILPLCPLPQGVALAFSDEERALKVVATRLLKTDVTADSAEAFSDLAERYMPLSRLSLCYEDDYWRDHVLKLLRRACKLKLPQHLKDRLDAMRGELHETMGDFHSSHERWAQRVFDRQLELLKMQAEGEDGLFARYEKYVGDATKAHPDIIGGLMGWFAAMPHVELCNYRNHARLAQRLNYMRVSRQELYEVYAAVLLLERYGEGKTISGKGFKLPKELDTAKARKSFAKAMELQYMEVRENGTLRWRGTDDKGRTAELAYFLGKVYNYEHTISGNAGEDFPEESLDRLFCAKRLLSSLTQVYEAQKPQRWRSLINEMF